MLSSKYAIRRYQTVADLAMIVSEICGKAEVKGFSPEVENVIKVSERHMRRLLEFDTDGEHVLLWEALQSEYKFDDGDNRVGVWARMRDTLLQAAGLVG